MLNAALTADDLSDLRAVADGARNPDGSRRNLRATELDDRGARLIGLGLVVGVSSHIVMTEAGWAELEARDAASAA